MKFYKKKLNCVENFKILNFHPLDRMKNVEILYTHHARFFSYFTHAKEWVCSTFIFHGDGLHSKVMHFTTTRLIIHGGFSPCWRQTTPLQIPHDSSMYFLSMDFRVISCKINIFLLFIFFSRTNWLVDAIKKNFVRASRVIFFIFSPCECNERNVKKEKSCLIDRRKNYERIEAAITTSEKKITRRSDKGWHLRTFKKLFYIFIVKFL